MSTSPRSASIRRVLQHVLTASIAATGAGCSTSVAGEPGLIDEVDPEVYDELACAADGRTDLIAGAPWSASADYVELYERHNYGGEELEPATLVQSVGTACATATDEAACQADLEAAVASATGFSLGQCVQVCTESFFVMQTGDVVEVVDTPEGLDALLDVIDAPSEAVITAMHAGYSVQCANLEQGGIRVVDDGYEVVATRLTSDCAPVETTRYLLWVRANGKVEELASKVIDSDSGSCIGRRPHRLVAQRARGTSTLGAYFGSVAHLEAASVPAFETLRRELAHHGAPRSLVQRAERARRDEIRHARMMARLARRYGGTVPDPVAPPGAIRSLEAVALDNAVEGCVRETFGALVGHWQARFAAAPGVRRAMKSIAADETRHAELSWAIDAWAMSRLDEATRRRIRAARRRALEELAVDMPECDDPSLVIGAGVPSRRAHRELVARFRSSQLG